jgi:hypothetical protein
MDLDDAVFTAMAVGNIVRQRRPLFKEQSAARRGAAGMKEKQDPGQRM